MYNDIYKIAVTSIYIVFAALTVLAYAIRTRDKRAQKKFDRDIARVPGMQYYRK